MCNYLVQLPTAFRKKSGGCGKSRSRSRAHGQSLVGWDPQYIIIRNYTQYALLLKPDFVLGKHVDLRIQRRIDDIDLFPCANPLDLSHVGLLIWRVFCIDATSKPVTGKVGHLVAAINVPRKRSKTRETPVTHGVASAGHDNTFSMITQRPDDDIRLLFLGIGDQKVHAFNAIGVVFPSAGQQVCSFYFNRIKEFTFVSNRF